jgi:putative DNA primase/helicase
MAHNSNIHEDDLSGQPADQARPPKPTALRVIPEGIPLELKALSQWVVWRYFWQKGKWDKPLLQSHTGNLASHSSPKTWSTYQAAVNAYLFNGANLDGIGFVFTKENGFVGVDLDDCRDPQTGVIEPWAQEIIDQFNTYTEISTSGTGVHLIGQGTLPGQGVKTASIEMYDHVRYFCTTGNVLPGRRATINTIPQELITNLYQRLREQQAGAKQKVDSSSPNGTGPSPFADDHLILEKALGARNGAKVAQLWSGDVSGYQSHSEADLALCRELAFYTQDAEQIDRIFRQSGLMREKWERTDYRLSTIDLAIKSAAEHWRGGSAESSNGQPTGEPHTSQWCDNTDLVLLPLRPYTAYRGPRIGVRHG